MMYFETQELRLVLKQSESDSTGGNVETAKVFVSTGRQCNERVELSCWVEECTGLEQSGVKCWRL